MMELPSGSSNHTTNIPSCLSDITCYDKAPLLASYRIVHNPCNRQKAIASKYGSRCSKGLHTTVYLVTFLTQTVQCQTTHIVFRDKPVSEKYIFGTVACTCTRLHLEPCNVKLVWYMYMYMHLYMYMYMYMYEVINS